MAHGCGSRYTFFHVLWATLLQPGFLACVLSLSLIRRLCLYSCRIAAVRHIEYKRTSRLALLERWLAGTCAATRMGRWDMVSYYGLVTLHV
ncbi:hypothetical protein F4824DRAFT_482503, partial [Ustulina deusta]